MKLRHELVLAIAALLLGVSENAVSGQSASRHCSSEECACEKALKQNTVEALEAFLKKYPQSAKGTSACAALAVPPDSTLSPKSGENADGNPPNKNKGSAYGG